MNWTLTDTFDYYSPDANYWKFDSFNEARITGEDLTSSIETLYLWKETKGQPVNI